MLVVFQHFRTGVSNIAPLHISVSSKLHYYSAFKSKILWFRSFS